MAFADHFSAKSERYAQARPTYPEALFEFIAGQAPARERAWDCATGSGQAAVGLARHFEHVEATDVFFTWGYDRSHVAPEFDAAFERLVLDPLRPYWPKENALLWRGYRDLPFPFAPIESPKLAIEMSWSFEELMAYAATWSAHRRLWELSGNAWLEAATTELVGIWGAAEKRVVTMPLHIRCGRHAAGT